MTQLTLKQNIFKDHPLLVPTKQNKKKAFFN